MSDHTDGCSYQSCTRKLGPMTEREAAERLRALLNEIQAAGHQVALEPMFGSGYCIAVGGDLYLPDPQSHGDLWEVKSP